MPLQYAISFEGELVQGRVTKRTPQYAETWVHSADLKFVVCEATTYHQFLDKLTHLLV